MISIDRKAKDIEEVTKAVLEQKDKIKTFVVVTFDFAGLAEVRYAAHWQHLGIAAALCQAEFQRCYEGENV